MTASAEETLRDYYEALRRGEPLYPYFAEREDVVKVGVGERLVGYDAVAEGLREQTRTTDDWTVESREPRVAEQGDCAWFADRVRMAWTAVDAEREYDVDARWSGTLSRRHALEGRVAAGDEWLFVGMHVSVPHGN
jgi:hypothetical protein